MMLGRRRENPTSFDAKRHRPVTFATPPSAGRPEQRVRCVCHDKETLCVVYKMIQYAVSLDALTYG